ncbi:F184B protein, partial [Polypterus senegalus]
MGDGVFYSHVGIWSCRQGALHGSLSPAGLIFSPTQVCNQKQVIKHGWAIKGASNHHSTARVGWRRTKLDGRSGGGGARRECCVGDCVLGLCCACGVHGEDVPHRLTLDIRRNIVSYVLNDWDRFKVWTDDGTGDNYTTQENYKSEMLKPFTYGSACELMAAAELFSCRFQVYRNGQIFYTFGEPPMPLKHLRFTGDNMSSGHFDVYECFNSQKLDAKLTMKLVVCLQPLTDAECHFNTSLSNTNVIYVLNTKCDEHESNLQTLREAHQEEIQRIVEETREKILQYKNRVGEEMDLRQQLQAMEDSLEQHEKLKEEALSDFEMYRKQTEERELRTETEQAERIMALSKEMLDMKKEFEDRLQSFAELQDKLNQEKAQMMAELEKASQESISLQDECQMLRRSNVDEKGKLEEICNTKTHALREEVEELRTEKHKMEESFEHQICTMKATHEEEYEALRRTLQQTMADTLKLWQQRELEQRKALQTSLQQKLKKAEAELEVKCQKLNDCKKHSLKLQDRIQDLGAEAEESRRKILDAVANQRKAEEELSVAKERLILQESEILKKSEELLFHSKASAEVDDLRSQISQLQRRVKELDQKNNEKSNDHAQHIRQQIHGEELHKAKQLPDEEKARLKEQLIKGLEEVTKKHAAELKSVQNTMEAEKRKIQKDLQAQFEEFKKKMEEERKQIEKEKDDLTCQLKESLIKVSHLESSIQRQHNNPDTVLIETQAVKPNRKLEEEVEQARCLILDLKKELALGKRQHQTAMLAWEAEKERIKERISVLTEAKCKEKIRSSNFAECAEKNESQEQYLACLLLQKDKGAEISEGHKGKLEEMYLQPGGLPLDSKQLLLYKALKKLESKLFKEKELLQQELQDSIQLNHNLKTQLETLNQQMQKQTENNKAHAFKDINLQDQMKSLHSQLEGCQNEVLTLRKENENLKVQLDSVYSELELRRQQTLQLHISEEQQRRIKEKEEKLKRSESRLGDLQVIGKLQDKLNEREQVLKMLVEDLRFQQHSSLNSESSNVRGYETRSRAGSLTPTLKKKKMEEIPPRVISVPNLRCYEKSFKTCEPQSGKQSPHTERSMFPDHRNSMVVPISPQAYMPEPQPPAG